MADQKISDLAAAASLTDADLVELEQPGETAGTRSRKLTLALLRKRMQRQDLSVLSNSAGTVTVDCSLGRNFTITLVANVTTLTLTNLAGAGFATELEIEIKQDGTGGRTFALPAAFRALGGSDTAIASAANAVTVLSAKTFDNGTTWRYAMQESAP
jgi:hypothetical protein